ncbi:MAG: PDZ domain-containing protein, partial [Planctomycetota bacterium]
LEPNDVVISVDGHLVRDAADLRSRISGHEIGEVVEIEVLRGGETKKIEVRVGGAIA